MVKIYIDEKKSFYLSKQLKQEIDTALYAVKFKDQDLVIIIDGDEGGGKSKTARMVAFYCSQVLNSSFDVDGVTNIHNDIDKYIKTSIEGEPYMVNILDESRKILNRKSSMSRDAKRFTNYLSECRSKNQVHIILLPTYHDLDRYVAQWRMSMVIHMYKRWTPDEKIELGGHELHIGSFRLYINNNNMRYYYDQKGFSYPKSYVVRDKFSNVEVLSDKGLQAYEDQKEGLIAEKYMSDKERKALEDEKKLLTDKRLMSAFERSATLKRMTFNVGKLSLFMHSKGYAYTEIGRACGIHDTLINKWAKFAKDVQAGVEISPSPSANVSII